MIGIEQDLPQFGQLKDIFIVNGDVFFLIQVFKTLKFSEHYKIYHSYVVSGTAKESAVN